MEKAVVHIFASYNNIIITATDITGAETVARASGGMFTKAQHKEGSPYTAMKVAENVASQLKELGIKRISIRVRAPGGIKWKTPGPGAEAAIRTLTRFGFIIEEIENVTPIPHDGCRPQKKFIK